MTKSQQYSQGPFCGLDTAISYVMQIDCFLCPSSGAFLAGPRPRTVALCRGSGRPVLHAGRAGEVHGSDYMQQIAAAKWRALALSQATVHALACLWGCTGSKLTVPGARLCCTGSIMSLGGP